MHDNYNEGRMTIIHERHDVLQNVPDEGSTSIMQDFEEVQEIEMDNNSAIKYSNSNDSL